MDSPPRGPIGPDPTAAEVAAHYDDLDPFYRELWGPHVHHGLWERGDERPETATRRLVDLVAAKAGARSARVCDVGCGYGETARILAAEYGASVTALTVSKRQFEAARRLADSSGNPRFLLRDWLDADLPSESFDAVVAIESLSHMRDRGLFFRRAARVLRPGGRLVVCAWLAAEAPSRWERRLLLDPICREGRLAALESIALHRRRLADAGFEVEETRDLSRQVRRTWTVILRRGLGRLPTARYRKFFFDRRQANRGFAVAAFRIWLAYRTGSLRYGLLVGRRGAAAGSARSAPGRSSGRDGRRDGAAGEIGGRGGPPGFPAMETAGFQADGVAGQPRRPGSTLRGRCRRGPAR